MQNQVFTEHDYMYEVRLYTGIFNKVALKYIELETHLLDELYSNPILSLVIIPLAIVLILGCFKIRHIIDIKQFKIFSFVWVCFTFISSLWVFLLREGTYNSIFEIISSVSFSSPIFLVSFYLLVLILIGIGMAQRKNDILLKMLFGIFLIILSSASLSNIPHAPYYQAFSMGYFTFISLRNALVISWFVMVILKTLETFNQKKLNRNVDSLANSQVASKS